MIELLGILATILACTGVWLNNRKLRRCFYLFFASNAMCLIIHVHAGLWQGADVKTMIVRDAIFLFLSVEGWCLWGKRR